MPAIKYTMKGQDCTRIFYDNGACVFAGDDGTFQVSQYEVWLPGIYNSAETWLEAVTYRDHELGQIQKLRDGGVVTMDDLKTIVRQVENG